MNILFFSALSSGATTKLSETDLVIVFDGNSLTRGFDNSGIDQYYPKEVQTWLTGKTKTLTFASYGVDGQDLTTMIANAAANIDPNIDSGKTNVCVVWEDANDIILNDLTGQQNYNNMVTYVSARRTAGFEYVIVLGGYYPRTPYAAGVTQGDLDRQHDYFELLAANNLGSVTVDLRNTANIGGARAQAQNATYFNDYLHLQALGYDEIANSVINEGILTIFEL